jgi:hypothetical protein
MRLVRGRRDARWLPSRHNFAIVRLIAFLRCRAARPEPADVILVIDRNQNAFESFALSIVMLIALTSYLCVTLFAAWPAGAGLIAALPLALVAAEIPFLTLAVFFVAMTPEKRLRVQSMCNMLLHLAAAGWFAAGPTWARFVAWPILGLAALNAIAAVVVVLLRGPMARLESSFGGFQSAS